MHLFLGLMKASFEPYVEVSLVSVLQTNRPEDA